MENVQTFLCSKNKNFLRRFDSSTNAPLINFDICLRALRYMTKAFTLTVIILKNRGLANSHQKR